MANRRLGLIVLANPSARILAPAYRLFRVFTVGGEEEDLVNCNVTVGIFKNSKKSVCRCEDSRIRIGQHNEP